MLKWMNVSTVEAVRINFDLQPPYLESGLSREGADILHLQLYRSALQC